MEIISIEKKTFEEMVSRFDELVTKVGTLCPKDDDKKMSGGWTARMSAYFCI